MSHKTKHIISASNADEGNLPTFLSASLTIATSKDASSPLFQIPKEVLVLIIEYCIGTCTSVQQQGVEWTMVEGRMVILPARLGYSCLTDRMWSDVISRNDDTNALLVGLAVHWTNNCVPLLLSCHRIQKTVQGSHHFRHMSCHVKEAFKGYHKYERTASCRRWFDHRRAIIRRLGFDVGLTLHSQSEDSGPPQLESIQEVMERFPYIDMNNRWFYCVASQPIASANGSNYIKAVQLAVQMNTEYQQFLVENYKCTHCRNHDVLPAYCSSVQEGSPTYEGGTVTADN